MDTSSLPVPSLSELETHTFRWTMIIEANTSVCAIPTMNTNNPNDTAHDGQILVISTFSQDDDQTNCHGNNSVFMLIGNPGMIWHLTTGQCIHKKILTNPIPSQTDENQVLQKQSFTLMTSDQCDTNNTNVALFKYDKNQPQQLVFLQDFNSTTGEVEEWCIGNSNNSIQVMPECGFDADSNIEIFPMSFIEDF